MEIEKKSNGALVGLIVIIIILIVGGIYMWMSSKNSAPTTSQYSSGLNALEQNIATIDTSTGVDASAVK